MLFQDKTQYKTSSAEKTRRLGEKLGLEILKKRGKKGAVVLALKGQLGSGKTTFIQGLARGLGIKERITSPTFALIKKFKIPNIKGRKIKIHSNFYHLDCYRLEKPSEMEKLGIKKIFKEDSNIAAVEWAEKIEKLLPAKTLRMSFSFKKHGERTIKVIRYNK